MQIKSSIIFLEGGERNHSEALSFSFFLIHKFFITYHRERERETANLKINQYKKIHGTIKNSESIKEERRLNKEAKPMLDTHGICNPKT